MVVNNLCFLVISRLLYLLLLFGLRMVIRIFGQNLVNDRHSFSYPYIYNRDGTELYCLKEHGAALRLCYLEQHRLLASINEYGQLHFQDVTDGRMIGSYRTGFGRTDVCR
ncbi:hypothetical protein RchiOBHm_Chr1g0336801 [Rosa chinensis]|uniref:Uncharacterized protein n=1 Tax=Rosa chinensis TaxID=74649 RepID=A0A2P6SCR8_ROSCH|nr:hypothetical protein RchiOBHm_Chr1g0336801 [Rosa chinensis]